MNNNFVYSDDSCCFRCSRHYFDLVKRDYCNRDGHTVKPYNKACAYFNEIRGRFGGWTEPVKEGPTQLTLF